MKDTHKTHYIITKDFLVSGEMFTLLYNSESEMLQTDPQPNPKELPKYYESDAYISHTDSKEGFVSLLYQIIKKRAINNKSNLITKLNNGFGTLLDIGSGTGEFLVNAKKKGWNVQGIEPNSKARALASKKGIELLDSIQELPNKEFDVITLWHVLEHLPNLDDTIKTIERLLKPDGVLIIAVPNFRSYDAKHYRNFWAAFDVPRHLWHFSRKSMTVLFSEKIQLQKIKPLMFDSFYVSLLSEKNKTGKQNFIRAFFIGLWSNIAALKTKEYSSLIYCYKKAK